MQGFYFSLLQYSQIQAFTARFAVLTQFYTVNAAKQRTGLYRGVSCNLTNPTTYDTRPAQAAIMPPAPRWSVSQPPQHLQHIHQIPTPRRTLYRPAQPPYYNKVYKGAAARPCYGSMPDSAADRRPCQPGGVSMFPTSSDLRSGTGSTVRAYPVSPAPSTRRGSPVAGTRRAARNHWRLAPQLFSGFRPIANRGQQ